MRCDKVEGEGDASRTIVRRAGAGWGGQLLVKSTWDGGKESEAGASTSSNEQPAQTRRKGRGKETAKGDAEKTRNGP
jgi:hypothetical protein